MLNDQNRMLAELLGRQPAHRRRAQGRQPRADAVDRRRRRCWRRGTRAAEDGHVVADLLFGVVNPSGKLPTTYPRSEDDTLYAGRPERYPGTDEGDGYPVIRYSEGLQMATAGIQAQGIEPLFPLRSRPVLHDLRPRRRRRSIAPDGAARPGHGQRHRDQHRRPGRRRGRPGLPGLPGVGASRRSGSSASRRCSSSRAPASRSTITIDPAATHHPLSVWDRRRARLRRSSRGPHRLRRHLERGHPPHAHPHRRRMTHSRPFRSGAASTRGWGGGGFRCGLRRTTVGSVRARSRMPSARPSGSRAMR